jgi:hypothetical protein
MSSGRYILRGWAWQARAFASRALADSGVVPTPQPARDGVAIEFRSRVATLGLRGRTVIADERSRTTNGGHWR